MKYCTRCGARLDENAIFCPNCGTQINVADPEEKKEKVFSPADVEAVKEEPIEEAVPVTQPKQAKCWSVFAKIGYVFGIIGFIFSFIPFINLCTIMIPIIGIIFSALGKHSFDYGKKARKGFGLALAGTIIAFVWGCLSVGIIIAVAQDVAFFSGDIWKEIFDELDIYM